MASTRPHCPRPGVDPLRTRQDRCPRSRLTCAACPRHCRTILRAHRPRRDPRGRRPARARPQHRPRHRHTPLQAWLAAAHGETLAAAGHADDARRAFDTAIGLLPADPIDPALPFLFLADAHLDRWRGHALARVGAPEATDQLTTALARLPTDFVRARTGLLVDLAYAHAAAGDRDAALAHAQQARRLAAQIKSDRHQRRLSRLVLPGSGGTAA
ncbi:MAG: hypothetical protein ACRDSF_16410 [Pseudonocardiaceae bacterium]